MEINRLTRLIGDRWGVVLIGATVGLLGALIFASLTPSDAESLYEATAPMRFDPGEGETIPDLADDVREARDFALIAADPLLSSDPTSRITLNLAEARLFFITQGVTEQGAIDKATALRQSYLDVDPELGGGVDEELAKLEQEALALDEQIESLQPALTQRELTLIQEQTSLDQTISAIQNRLRALILAEAAAATTEALELVVAEREALVIQLESAQEARTALGPVPVVEQSTTDALLLSTLVARKDLLNAEYQRLYLRKLGVAGLGTAEVVTVQDFASERIAPLMLAGGGLLGGIAIATIGLLMVSRTRRTVWLPEDISIAVLGEIPSRDIQVHGIDVWYDTAEGGPRKTAVQALRSAVQAQAPAGSTIALSAHNLPAEDVQALAADLAGSMASAGDSVLIIDANLHSHVALGDFRVGGVSLAEILRLQSDAPDFAAAVDNAVGQAHVVRPNLAVIPSGPPPDSPADAVAGRQFRSLIASAESRYDTTLIVVDDLGTPSSLAAMQRIGHSIVVTAPGSTTETEINGLIGEAVRLRINIAGAVLMRKHRRFNLPFLGRVLEEEASPAPDTDESSIASPMVRLANYSVPDERRTAVVPHSALGDLATSIGGQEQAEGLDSGLGQQLLAAMNGVSPSRAYEAVADYVISRAEDMVTARYGYGDLSEDLIHDVSEFGFLTLRPVRGHRTVGSWLTFEIEAEAGDTGGEVVAEVERLLSDNRPDVGIDQWLDAEFFGRHLARTQGEPSIWHLVSSTRRVSLLVPARRMTTGIFEQVIGEVVGKSIDELERRRKTALARPDVEGAAEFEQQIWEIRDFEKSIRTALFGPTGGKGEAWSPDWEQGARKNLAPFQREGLLPVAVLTGDEADMSATA